MRTPEAPLAPVPPRLQCGTCRNWELTAVRALPDGERIGQCARFCEARGNGARPRCNICWEPILPALRVMPAPNHP